MIKKFQMVNELVKSNRTIAFSSVFSLFKIWFLKNISLYDHLILLFCFVLFVRVFKVVSVFAHTPVDLDMDVYVHGLRSWCKPGSYPMLPSYACCCGS